MADRQDCLGRREIRRRGAEIRHLLLEGLHLLQRPKPVAMAGNLLGVVAEVFELAGRCVGLQGLEEGLGFIQPGAQLLGRHDVEGRPMEAAGPVENRSLTRFPTKTWDAGKRRRGPRLPQGPPPATL